MQRILFIIFTLLLSLSSYAQTQEFAMVHQGNRAYKRGEWSKAEQYYRKALDINPKNARAMFDLGDTYLSQQNEKDALEWFTKASKTETDKRVKAMTYHNIGYIHHTQKKYSEAIEAYKQALRLNPNDEDTRYNLALAQKMKKQQDKQKQQNQQQPPPEEQKDKQDKQNQQQQQQQEQMPQDNIDQLLNLARQTEQQTRRKLDEAKRPRRKQLEKNW